jgi:hypothetical protein
MKISFNAEPEIAARIEKLRQITNLDLDQVINRLLSDNTEQIVDDGDTDGIQWLLSPYSFDRKEAALEAVRGYDAFIAELKAGGDRCYHDQAKAIRKNGKWEIMFKSTDPRDVKAKGLEPAGK